jgi:hypothetical protein
MLNSLRIVIMNRAPTRRGELHNTIKNNYIMMKKRSRLLVTMIAVMGLLSFIPVFSQEDPVSEFSVGADIYSNYIWRGCKYGAGPAIQPAIKYSGSSFTLGAWGSVDFSGYQEADLYLSFSLPAGLSLGVTDSFSIPVTGQLVFNPDKEQMFIVVGFTL